MADALQLLTLPHNLAMQQMVQEALVPGVNVSDLVISPPTPGSGREMVSRIYISGNAYDNPNWPYHGYADFGYTRLDLHDFFVNSGVNLWLRYDTPFSSADIAQQLTEIFGIVMEPHDFFQEQISLQPNDFTYTFKAGPESKRWMGQVNILIKRTPMAGT